MMPLTSARADAGATHRWPGGSGLVAVYLLDFVIVIIMICAYLTKDRALVWIVAFLVVLMLTLLWLLQSESAAPSSSGDIENSSE